MYAVLVCGVLIYLAARSSLLEEEFQCIACGDFEHNSSHEEGIAARLEAPLIGT